MFRLYRVSTDCSPSCCGNSLSFHLPIQSAVDKRRQDYNQIVGGLVFKQSRAEAADGTPTDTDTQMEDEVPGVGEGMRDAELLVWLGDFNYR